ncbi:DEAD/DEAH box helicase [[Pseudopropionibacterium] massiliense]|uniref:DEAD/DEAH box helicase n=1 Tax=[Pseudopropionibacterium] massiliense TaxID=2220000 RepID=UPI0013EEF88E|nr:DEAD/DEAH box helicase [[Pseudopropionibacterium] massiliense]
MNWEWVTGAEEAVVVRRRPASPGVRADWPGWLDAELVDGFRAAGIDRPWRHQVEFAELARAGRHTAICTPTGSGKSLAYLMPVLAALREPRAGRGRGFALRRPTALYLAPTKALAHDQARAAETLVSGLVRIGALDGDSDEAERRFAREHATLVLTNPDMLHFSVLPNHRRWSALLGGLRYVVVDEAHRYQGVFGAHVAQVLRRLRRLAAAHGAEPTILLSSATAPNAADFGGALIGEERVDVIADSAAPAAARTVVLWQPSTNLNRDTSRLLAGLVDDATQTLAFVASRAGAELTSLEAAELAAEPARIASYRGGYLAMERRDLEAALHTGEILGLATTNALELGIDVSGVDAVLVSGFPGKLSAFWQQAGRAGRAGREALVVLLARENPLDAYLLQHPDLILDAPVEAAVCHPQNPHVLGPHLAAAAQEHPLTAADERWFGPTALPLAAHLAAGKVLRDRGGTWYWTRADRAVDHINLRSTAPRPVEIIERSTGQVIGVVDPAAADRTVHRGAVYLHRGRSFVVTELDVEERHAMVVAVHNPWYTQAESTQDIAVLREHRSRPLGSTTVHFGDVRLSWQVTGYLRRDETTHEVLDSTPLDCPEHTLTTQAVWWSVPETLERELGWGSLRLGAAAHAAEHTSIGLLPAFAPCDRWDIGGVSTARHPDTGLATVFVHDGLPGGAGFAARAHEVAEQWLAATLERLRTCRCESGCPACVVSPKCGNANQVLDKAAAAELLRRILREPGGRDDPAGSGAARPRNPG